MGKLVTPAEAGAIVLAILLAPPVAAASPAPVQSATCPPNDAPTLVSSYAQAIDDKPSLRLIAQTEGMDPKHQAATLQAIRTTLDPMTEERIEYADGDCIAQEAVDRATRLVYGVIGAWPNTTEADRGFLYNAAIRAMIALRDRDALPPNVVDAALAPFGTTRSILAPASTPAPSPLPTPGADPNFKVIAIQAKCIHNRSATALRQVEPNYPAIARNGGTSGAVSLTVFLDDDGFVRKIAVTQTTTGAGDAAQALTEAAILSAGSSGYAPEVANCKRVGGAYPFVVDFSNR